ncbi:molybdate metabolism regulator MolR-like protein [Escherichia coli]|uniref:Molybdate metabolism regulator MolR-like protein n=1 Tax=Escherichia coli TaxID=562 RepID=A0A377D5X9_ECOLX|nr:molybdate metabolism regulator MolR-like protein [Escherichia coli]
MLQTAANRWQRTDVWPALEHLLKQSPIEIYPTRIPKALISGSRQCGPGRALSRIISLLPMTHWKLSAKCCALPRADVFIADWKQLKTFCQPQTLAAFAWDLFTAWQQAGAPAKDNWAFLALSLFGDESTARDLTTQILAWPQEGKSARAVSGLNILTQMNNDMALIQLHHISQRAKSRPLRDNAAEFLQVVAEKSRAKPGTVSGQISPNTGS